MQLYIKRDYYHHISSDSINVKAVLGFFYAKVLPCVVPGNIHTPPPPPTRKATEIPRGGGPTGDNFRGGGELLTEVSFPQGV